MYQVQVLQHSDEGRREKMKMEVDCWTRPLIHSSLSSCKLKCTCGKPKFRDADAGIRRAQPIRSRGALGGGDGVQLFSCQDEKTLVGLKGVGRRAGEWTTSDLIQTEDTKHRRTRTKGMELYMRLSISYSHIK